MYISTIMAAINWPPSPVFATTSRLLLWARKERAHEEVCCRPLPQGEKKKKGPSKTKTPIAPPYPTPPPHLHTLNDPVQQHCQCYHGSSQQAVAQRRRRLCRTEEATGNWCAKLPAISSSLLARLPDSRQGEPPGTSRPSPDRRPRDYPLSAPLLRHRGRGTMGRSRHPTCKPTDTVVSIVPSPALPLPCVHGVVGPDGKSLQLVPPSVSHSPLEMGRRGQTMGSA